MESHSLLPSNNIKLEPACEAENVQSCFGELGSEIQDLDMMDSKIPTNIKTEQPAVCIDYPDEGTRNMEPHSLLSSNNIKLEPACEANNVQSSTREIISEIEELHKMECKIPASVKIEQPEVYVDYPGEDIKIQPCSQSSLSLQEQSHLENKMMFGNIDWKPVKQEPPDALCEDRNHRFSKIVGMTSCDSIQEMMGHNTESRMPEVTTFAHHQEVSLIGTENGYTASQHEHCNHMPERVSSMTEINTKLCFANENCQLYQGETPVKHSPISGTSLDYASCSLQRIQTGDQPHMSVCDVTNGDAFLHIPKTAVTKEKPYKCIFCGASFINSSSLKYHVTIHTGERPYKCDVCNASFAATGNLKCHMRTHIGEKPYKCTVCDASFAAPGNLKCHMRTHTGEKPYKCAVCDASFARTSSLKCHMRTHTGDKPYKCDVCLLSFPQSDSLNGHMRTHTGEKPYKCDVCVASFTSKRGLKYHMTTHSGEKPYKCAVCVASFTSTGGLKCHMRTHTGDKPYKCDVCLLSFTQSCSLNYHMRTHTGEKPYKCADCDASFTSTGGLKRHMRTHTGERSYKCAVCVASFTCRRGLKYHMITHSGEKPYKCTVCVASFTSTGGLNRHMRTHTGDKPYKCDVCISSFTKPSFLKRHMRTHTGY